MVLRASAGAALVLLVGGAVALAVRSSPAAQATPEPSAVPSGTDVAASGSVSGSSGSPLLGTSSSSAPLPAGRNVLVLGDSLALDVYAWLADLLPDRYVSYAAVVGRDTPATLVALRTLDAQGDVPPVVVVSLGTNDLDATSFRTAAEQIMTLLGPNRCVVWSDVVRPDSIGGGAGGINTAIDQLAATYPNMRIFRWSALVAAHPDWLSGDGIHPGQEGAAARAKGFADAALACSPLDASAPRASRDYLPPSAFNAPGGTSTDRLPTRRSDGTKTSRSSATATSSASPTRSTTSSPTAGTATSSPPPTTPSSSAPAPSSVPPVGSTPPPSVAASP